MKGIKHTEKRKNKAGNAHKKPIIIDGTEYDSRKTASEILNIPKTTIFTRLNSNKYKNYKYKQ